MAFDQTDLRQAFEHARDVFNNQPYDDLTPLLDANMVWKKLHHADSITRASNVIAWLKREKTGLNPQFLPDMGNADISPASGKVKFSALPPFF